RGHGPGVEAHAGISRQTYEEVTASAGAKFLKPSLLDNDGVARTRRIVERHLSVDLLAPDLASQLDRLLVGARRKATGNGDYVFRRQRRKDTVPVWSLRRE